MQTSVAPDIQQSGQSKHSSPASPAIAVSADANRRLLLGLAFVCGLAALVFFLGLGSFPLFNPDEALYAEPAREMLETGEYVTTLLNYVVRFTKPPLVIWAMAGCFQIFGVGEFGARFFGAACGVVLTACTYLFAARHISTRAALPAALTLVSAPLFLGTAREAITDMPLSLFLAGAQMAFFQAQQNGYKTRSLWLGYGLTGLAVMTKGPVGVVLPVAILLAWHILKGDLLNALKGYRLAFGAAIVGLIALPWFVLEISITHGAYFQEFIVRENFQRFTANVDSHKQPVWYHLAAMAGGYFPWTLLLPPALWSAAAPYCKNLLASLGDIKARQVSLYLQAKALWQRSAQYLNSLEGPESCAFYCMLWAAITLVFYSASVSKLLPYTLPAFPALAALVAWHLERAWQRVSFRALALPVLAMILVYSACGLIAPHLTTRLRHAPAELITIISGYAAAQALVCLVALGLLRLKKLTFAMTFVTTAAALCIVSYMGRTLNVVSAKWEGVLPSYSRFAGLSKEPIIVFDMRKPGVPFYALRQVENINGFWPLKKRLAQIPSAYILCRATSLPALKSLNGVKVLASQGDFAMVRVVKIAN